MGKHKLQCDCAGTDIAMVLVDYLFYVMICITQEISMTFTSQYYRRAWFKTFHINLRFTKHALQQVQKGDICMTGLGNCVDTQNLRIMDCIWQLKVDISQ